jgi:peptidoglycan/LPS O-acetylase OafA/YrhL
MASKSLKIHKFSTMESNNIRWNYWIFLSIGGFLWEFRNKTLEQASIYLIMPSDENLKKIQKWALPFEKSAAFSYTLYITHYPIFILLTGIFQKPDGLLGYGIYIIGMLAFTFAFSFLLAKVVEQRDTTRQWFDRIVPGRKVTSGRIAQ